MSLFNQISGLGKGYNSMLYKMDQAVKEHIQETEAIEKYSDHKAVFEVSMHGREYVFGIQSDAIEFSWKWKALYEVVIYLMENGTRVRKVIYSKQY